MSKNFESDDWKVGFYYDLKFLIAGAYSFFVIVVLILHFYFRFMLDDLFSTGLIFLCLLIFLDLQEFMEVKVSRYGWICSKFEYKLASALLLLSILLVPVASFILDFLGENGWRLPQHLGFISFLFSAGLLILPIITGIALTLSCYLDFLHELNLSLWKRDPEITEVLLQYSFFYRRIFGRKKASKRW